MVADIAGQSMCAWSYMVTFVMGPLLGDLIRLYCISVLTKKKHVHSINGLWCSLVTFLQGCTVHRRPNRYCCISGVYMVTFVMGPPLGDLCNGDLCNGPSTNMILLHRTPCAVCLYCTACAVGLSGG